MTLQPTSSHPPWSLGAAMMSDEKETYSVLGPLRVSFAGDDIGLGPVRQQAVLLSLIRSYNQVVPSSRLLKEVWGERPPKSGVRIIPPYIYRLRNLSPGGDVQWSGVPVQRDREGYALRISRDQLDLNVFSDRVRQAEDARRSGQIEMAGKRLAGALEMWDGEPLAGIPGPMARSMRIQLAEQRLMAMERRIELDFLQGRYREVIPDLREIVEAHPLNEPMVRLLIRALCHCDRQADALNVFHELRTRLSEETGMDPSKNLQNLYAGILRSDPRVLQDELTE